MSAKNSDTILEKLSLFGLHSVQLVIEDLLNHRVNLLVLKLEEHMLWLVRKSNHSSFVVLLLLCGSWCDSRFVSEIL